MLLRLAELRRLAGLAALGRWRAGEAEKAGRLAALGR